MKPLHGHGGAAVFRVLEQDPILGSLFDLFSATFREPWVVQRFLPESSTATSASFWSTANWPGASTGCRRPTTCAPTWFGAAPRRPPNSPRANARSATRSARAAARPDPRRHRRDRRRPDRNQRHLADGHPRDPAPRRPRPRGEALGRDREEARREITSSSRALPAVGE